MFQRDYIMRMIEQLGQALQHILRLQQVEKFDEAQIEINRAGKTLLGMDMQILRSLEEAALPGLFGTGENLDGAACLAAGVLLHEEAHLLEQLQQPAASRVNYRKALQLYLEALLHNPALRRPEYLTRFDALLEKSPPDVLPDAVLLKLFRLYEALGRFGKAEDMLFFLADRAATDVFAEGIAFFRRMQNVPPAALIAGNLPPEEVAEGLSQWQKKFARGHSR